MSCSTTAPVHPHALQEINLFGPEACKHCVSEVTKYCEILQECADSYCYAVMLEDPIECWLKSMRISKNVRDDEKMESAWKEIKSLRKAMYAEDKKIKELHPLYDKAVEDRDACKARAEALYATLDN